jgi:hypothetical protein
LCPGGHIAVESRNPVVQPWADDRIEGHIDWPSQRLAEGSRSRSGTGRMVNPALRGRR